MSIFIAALCVGACGGDGGTAVIDPEALGYRSADLAADLAFPGAQKDETISDAVSDAEVFGVKKGDEQTVIVDTFRLKQPSPENADKVVAALAELLPGETRTTQIAGTDVTVVETIVGGGSKRRYLILYDESSGTVVSATGADNDAVEAFVEAVLEN